MRATLTTAALLAATCAAAAACPSTTGKLAGVMPVPAAARPDCGPTWRAFDQALKAQMSGMNMKTTVQLYWMPSAPAALPDALNAAFKRAGFTVMAGQPWAKYVFGKHVTASLSQGARTVNLEFGPSDELLPEYRRGQPGGPYYLLVREMH
ncbi:hypothetical protein [Deinococcus maricopensis]|uniref:Lipoprotein n=1 Tax=Deinococcus maricopensis (strain DSM 21211 / LMG 22137 / NRRL B-23946 / LB-34) TaxID=709986 RepID=E8U4L9_DEIML|nr:hypothetical protein [Deinococcus maricopensis]ADV68884.1 hypothetical protein Deima_3257 [Deinococcus maricopensis DSM 21211]